MLCWCGRFSRNIVTPLPSAFLALLVSASPPPSASPTCGSAGTLLLAALRLPSDLCSLLMSLDYGRMFKPSFRVPFPEIADQIVLRLPRAFLLSMAFSQTRSLFLSLSWRVYLAPGGYLPFVCPRDPSFRSPYSLWSWARWGFTTV